MDALRDSREVVGFGPFELDRASRELCRQGRRIRLQEQPSLVLSLLLDRAGAVVTRDEFRRLLWPASVYVDFDHGLNNAIARLREHLGDSATAPRYIETIPRVGYRFICPIRSPLVADEPLPKPNDGASPLHNGWAKGRWRYMGAIGLAAGLAIALLVIELNRLASTDAPLAADPEHASIAVLPFASMSAEPEDEYFADGLSEELLNRLAHIPGLQVAGRTSSFYFKGRQDSLPVIAQTLRVRHLLEGSVRRSGDRVRITAQLIDAKSGYHLWSETFDRQLDEIFDIQDDIALAVANALQVRLLPGAEGRLLSYGARNPEAYRLYLTGMALRKGASIRQDVEASRRAFEQAIALDPGFGAAYAGLAGHYFQLAAVSLVDPEEAARLGREAAERALELDPNGSAALRAAADFEMWKFRFLGDEAAHERSESLYRLAIEADGSNVEVYFAYARSLQWIEPKLAQAMFERASQLDPLLRFADVMAASAVDRQGMHDAARERLGRIVAPSLDWRWAAALGSFEAYHGRLDAAAVHLEASRFIEQQLQLWAIQLSLGDREAARRVLRTFEGNALAAVLRQAAEMVMDGDHRGALEHLDARRPEFPSSRVLDVPTARLALVAGEYDRARVILEPRLPDLGASDHPIAALQVLPALDLVLSWSATGRGEEARHLLDRITASLARADAPRLPLFTVQRARAHALAGESDLARRALERARSEGFRTTCALDLHPQPLLYVDCLETDPAFAALREDAWFQSWLAGIAADNDSQRQRLRVRIAARDGAAGDRAEIPGL